MKEEIWKPVIGYEKLYEVSDLGRVRSVDRFVHHGLTRIKKMKGRVLKPSLVAGYPAVSLSKNGKPTKLYVHRLVLTAFDFIEGCETLQVRHGDDTTTNCCLDNLSWGTAQDNADDRIKRDRVPMGSELPQHKLVEEQIPRIRELLAKGVYIRDVAEMFGVNPGTIHPIKVGRTWKHA